MFYTIQHTTTFRYSQPVRESVMELRMQPRSDGVQHTLSFQVRLDPKAVLSSFRDHLGNVIHSFNIPGAHERLTVLAESLIEMRTIEEPPLAVAAAEWEVIESSLSLADVFDMLLPSKFVYSTPLLGDLIARLHIRRLDDPMSTIRMIGARLYEHFEYMPNTTTVDSPIDDILTNGRGVCQDYAHVMLAICRELRIPARYVSGYLVQQNRNGTASAVDQSHAWVECFIPSIGWVGIDPTNNLTATERHIRVALGSDYADVPPTRGVYKGVGEQVLEVGVKIQRHDSLPTDEALLPMQYERVEMPPTLPVNGSRKAAPPVPLDIQIQQQQQ